ncbi:Malate/L-lactate dehydrogenase [Lophiotrema nucula]|uniref:Malate/L-lactate dehydrogenase n=1 Tax=Lophiotrema nucula TaxID=690887 RepID=A0A6A5YJ02_9PLEO|nr:Malate/L-lactate dehydrogenase [Lophiotrema nucula]
MPEKLDKVDDRLHVTAQNARAFVIAVLQGNGVSQPNAEIIAKCLIAADLRGVDTHGMNRIPSYMERVRQGVLNATATPILKQVTPVVAHVDGNNAFGFLGASLGMEAAVNSAKVFGIGMASVKHSNHFGMSAWLVQKALAADPPMLSLVFTNSSPALPVWGGKEKMLGVSPIACGAPGPKGEDKDFILDMAPSIAARGKIYKALRRGESIPTGWALDKEGRETTDPAAALNGGVMLPMGGPKGSALAIMMDVFSGILSGSAFAGGVTNPYDPSKPADVGHFLVAIRPDLFLGADESIDGVGSESGLKEFRKRMEVLYEKVVGSEKAAGIDRIYFPGELEILEEQKRLKAGIPLVQAEVEALNREAERMPTVANLTKKGPRLFLRSLFAKVTHQFISSIVAVASFADPPPFTVSSVLGNFDATFNMVSNQERSAEAMLASATNGHCTCIKEFELPCPNHYSHDFRFQELAVGKGSNEQPYFRALIFFNKKPEHTDEFFHEHWKSVHADLTMQVEDLGLNLVRYIQFHQDAKSKAAVAPLLEGNGGNMHALPWDGCAEFHARTGEDFVKFIQSVYDSKELVGCGTRFIDPLVGMHIMAGYDDLIYGSAISTSFGLSNMPGNDGVLPADERLIAKKTEENSVVNSAATP